MATTTIFKCNMDFLDGFPSVHDKNATLDNILSSDLKGEFAMVKHVKNGTTYRYLVSVIIHDRDVVMRVRKLNDPGVIAYVPPVKQQQGIGGLAGSPPETINLELAGEEIIINVTTPATPHLQ